MKLSKSFLLVALVFAADAEAATVGHVPTEFATIQAAIDAPRDTVYVHGVATYEENVRITHPLYLSWAPNDIFPGMPRVRRVSTPSPVNGNVTVAGLHILGGASATVASGTCTFELCRADSGLSGSAPVSFVNVRGCIVFGNLDVSGFIARSFMNTVSGGGISGGGTGTSPFQNNLVMGPAAVGINLSDEDLVLENIVRNCTDGIHALGEHGVGVALNLVEDCSGTGIVGGRAEPGPTEAFISENTVRRCGGSGVFASGSGVIVDLNTVETTGSDGIVINATTDHANNNRVTGAGGHGINADRLTNHMRGNVVTHCTGDGIRVNAGGKIHRNVVGNNGGRGIAVATDLGNGVLRSNTSYDNGDAGYEINTTDAVLDSVAYNIGYGNGVGLRRNGAGAIVLTCNDWIANLGGATSGVPTGATDVALDPQFCNRPLDIVTLAQTSPVLNLPGCGLIGALGAGCGTPVAVDGDLEPETMPLRVYPQPSNGTVRFSWPASSEGGRLEVYDAQGALRWSADVAPGASGITWRQQGVSGRTLPPGMYFARIRGRPELGSARVTIVN